MATATANTTKVLNLNRERDRQRYAKIVKNGEILPLIDFKDFVCKDAQSNMRYGKIQVFDAKLQGGIAVSGNLIYGLPSSVRHFAADTLVLEEDNLLAVLLPDYTKQRPKKVKHWLLLNADEPTSYSVSNLVSEFGNFNFPLISFNCLERFYADREAMTKKFQRGTVKVLDFTAEDKIKFTKEETKAYRKAKKAGDGGGMKPPKPGYSIIESCPGFIWHRSGATLLQDGNAFILMGQDEGTYFGVELPHPVQSIQQAYDCLVPEGAKNKAYMRQGEWFLVDVKESEVPTFPNIAFEVEGQSDPCYVLPKESLDSNDHELECQHLIVGSDGFLYAKNGSLHHSQHVSVAFANWVKFLRNTAKQSFSQDGVD